MVISACKEGLCLNLLRLGTQNRCNRGKYHFLSLSDKTIGFISFSCFVLRSLRLSLSFKEGVRWEGRGSCSLIYHPPSKKNLKRSSLSTKINHLASYEKTFIQFFYLHPREFETKLLKLKGFPFWEIFLKRSYPTCINQ